MQVFDIQINQNNMETTRHGSSDFPLGVYLSVMSKNILGFTNWHWHEEMQFCCVTNGEIRFLLNEKQYLLKEGDGIFINSGCLHMAKPEKNPDSAYICLDINPKLLSSFSGSVFETKYVAPYVKTHGLEEIELRQEIDWQKKILEGVRRIYTLCENERFGYELETNSILSIMWMLLLLNKPETVKKRGAKGSNGRFAVQKIITYISEHYEEHLTIDQIAKEVSFSSAECCRVFKRVTGETIFSYLQSYRLSKGMELLQNTGLSVSEIAYEVGFCSTSYFIEVFRGRFGVTPLQHRKGMEI